MRSRLILLALLLPACGLFGGGSTDAKGGQVITMDDTTVSFNATEGKTLFHSFPIENNLTQKITITNVVFENNLCNSFSFHSMTDSQGMILLNTSSRINLDVAPPVDSGTNQIFLNIRFDPESCVSHDYETLVHVFYVTNRGSGAKTYKNTFIVRSFGKAPLLGGDPDICEDKGNQEFIPELTSSVPRPSASKDYFLRVDQIRGFIFVEAETERTVIGTDLGGLLPGDFIPPHLKVTFSESGELTLSRIITCDEFFIPSSSSQTHFFGATTTVTSRGETKGQATQDLDTRETHFQVKDLKVRLRTEELPSKSSIRSPTGIFQVDVVSDLTTGAVPMEPEHSDALQKTSEYTDFEKDHKDEKIINLLDPLTEARHIEGSPLVDSQLTLVGKGTFNNSEESFIGSDETAKTFLIDRPAFIYIQLKATLTTREEGSK